jgi:hypothetical protein
MGTATSKGRRVLRLLRRLEVDRPIIGKQIGNCHDLVVDWSLLKKAEESPYAAETHWLPYFEADM